LFQIEGDVDGFEFVTEIAWALQSLPRISVTDFSRVPAESRQSKKPL